VIVSVLLAVRNGLPYLTEAVTSVLMQIGPSLELIAIDDCSDDGSGTWLNTLAAKDGRVRVVRNDVALGLTRSLNQALAMARGQYIARIDHDDLWLDDKLTKQASYLEQHPEVGLLGTAYLEEAISGCWSRPPLLPLCQTDAEIRAALYCFNPFLHSSIMIRRDLLISLGGYDEGYRYAQDYALWARVLKHTQAATLPEVLCLRRVGEANISFRKERAQRFNAMRAKLTWAKYNGPSPRILIPLLRDLAVFISPEWFRRAVRSGLHGPTAK
jgi:glycosyltransferase involved in cell wall biosynthesis